MAAYGGTPEQIGQVGVEPGDSAAHTRVKGPVEIFTAPQQAIHQLLRPPTIPRVEVGGASIERGVEQHAFPQVSEYIRRGDP
jgi:hypothetical protein